MQTRPYRPVRNTGGFTLIELMVAISIMAMLAMLSWRGLDGMARVQTQTQSKTDGVLALQAGLAQWQTDLNALVELPQMYAVARINALDYDGQVLRLMRRYAENATPTNAATSTNAVQTESIRVVAWTQRGFEGQTQWLRWQSGPLRTRGELMAAWQQAAQWAQNPGDAERKGEVSVANIDKWQIYYYRNNSWSNAQSTAEEAVGTAQPELPKGIRLVLTLSAGQALVGDITRDWVRPTLGGGK